MESRYVNAVVSFDSQDDVFTISFSESEKPTLGDSDIKTFKVIDFKLTDLMASGPEKAVNFIGSNILSSIERLAKLDIGVLKLNQSRFGSDIEHMNSLMEERANQGDPKAQEYLGAKYFNDSVEKQDVSLLDIAESWYKRAAENGSESASSFLKETWPDLKERYRQRIERERKQNDQDQD